MQLAETWNDGCDREEKITWDFKTNNKYSVYDCPPMLLFFLSQFLVLAGSTESEVEEVLYDRLS